MVIEAPGPEEIFLRTEAVANASQIIAVDKGLLTEPAARLPAPVLERVLEGIDIVLDR